MPSSLTDLEQRLADMQAQLDRLSQIANQQRVPVEERLAALADQYDAYLKRWALAIEWHVRAVSQLDAHVHEWKDVASRLQEDGADRLQALEASVSREWAALRKIHEVPAAELRQQAATLTEVSVAAATAAQQGFDRADARLAAFEHEFHRRMNDLRTAIDSRLGLLNPDGRPRLVRPGEPEFPSSEVAAHSSDPFATEVPNRPDEPRPDPLAAQASADDHPRASATPDTTPSELREPPETTAPGPLKPPDPEPSDQQPVPDHEPDLARSNAQQPRAWVPVVATLAIVAAAGTGWYARREARTVAARVQQTEARARQEVADATRRADSAHDEAAREIANAREVAARTQRIGDIMAAPDLIRFALAPGTDTGSASGRAMWSRSQGLLLSASRVPPPPARGANVVWMFTRFGPIRVGPLATGADGTATLVDPPRELTRAIIGVAVTAEATADAERPSSTVILTSAKRTMPTSAGRAVPTSAGRAVPQE